MNLEGAQHLSKDDLPPVLRLFLDPSYKYAKHKHSVETSSDGVHHTYTVVLSREPLVRPDGFIQSKLDNPTSDLMSQISSTSISETSRLDRSPLFMSSMPLTDSEKTTGDNQYFSLAMTADGPKVVPADLSKLNEVQHPEQSCSEVNGYSYLNAVPKSSSVSVKSTRTGKFVNMVHVKFILLHQDSCKRRVQSTFSDEFQSDTPLEDVVLNFQQLCARQLRGQQFRPRLSYCVGESNKKNSKPVTKSDLKKSLAQLGSSNNAVFEFALIADNNSE